MDGDGGGGELSGGVIDWGVDVSAGGPETEASGEASAAGIDWGIELSAADLAPADGGDSAGADLKENHGLGLDGEGVGGQGTSTGIDWGVEVQGNADTGAVLDLAEESDTAGMAANRDDEAGRGEREGKGEGAIEIDWNISIDDTGTGGVEKKAESSEKRETSKEASEGGLGGLGIAGELSAMGKVASWKVASQEYRSSLLDEMYEVWHAMQRPEFHEFLSCSKHTSSSLHSVNDKNSGIYGSLIGGP